MFDMKDIQAVAAQAQNKQWEYQDKVLDYLEHIELLLADIKLKFDEMEL